MIRVPDIDGDFSVTPEIKSSISSALSDSFKFIDTEKQINHQYITLLEQLQSFQVELNGIFRQFQQTSYDDAFIYRQFHRFCLVIPQDLSIILQQSIIKYFEQQYVLTHEEVNVNMI